jgi:hypothetical protein
MPHCETGFASVKFGPAEDARKNRRRGAVILQVACTFPQQNPFIRASRGKVG